MGAGISTGVGKPRRARREMEGKEGHTCRLGGGDVDVSGRLSPESGSPEKSAIRLKRLDNRASPMSTVLDMGHMQRGGLNKEGPS